MKKHLKSIVLIALTLSLALAFSLSLSGCTLGLNGKSAYEIALDNGFVGTEQEWLNSLIGKTGTNGQNATEIDIYSLFDAYKEEVNPNATFEEFLNTFMVVDYYDTEYASAKALTSVVRIRTGFEVSSGGFRPTTSTVYAEGSGVIYKITNNYAYIITNYHVLYESTSTATNKIATQIYVFCYGSNQYYTAEFVGGSIDNDIAIIKLDAQILPAFATTAQFADSNEIALGQRVIAVGNPLAEGISITSGVVSVDSEDIEMESLSDSTQSVSMRVIRTDTPINSGNSGGGLFNARGEVIGIVNAKNVSSGTENIGYAIPSNVAIGIANNVLENNSAKCLLGIEVTITNDTVIYDINKNRVDIIDSLVISNVVVGSLSYGNFAVGDKIVSAQINDGEVKQIQRFFYLSDMLYDVRLGDTLTIQVERNEQLTTITLTPTSANFNPF